MKKPLLIFALLLSVWVQAQTVSYSVDNYTDKLSPFKPSLTLLALDGFSPQVGLTVEGAIGTVLGYNAAWRHDIIRNYFFPKANIANIENERRSNYFEGSIDFFFVNRVKSSSLNIVTSSQNYGSYTSTNYFTAYDIDKRKQFGIHGGVYYYNKSVYMSGGKDERFEIWNGQTDEVPEGQTYVTNSNNTGIFAGLIFKKTRKATVHSGGWNYFRHYGRRIYLDAIFGGGKLKDFEYGNTTYTVKAVNSSPIGYRIGFEWDQMGVVTGFEFGLRPGPTLGIIPGVNYMNVNFSFNLFNSDKRYAMQSKKK